MKREKSKQHKSESEEDILQKAYQDMLKGLNKFGPGEILNILVQNACHDAVVFQLLLRFATTVSASEFLNSLKVIRTDKRTFNRLRKRGWVL
jgi:hypothetical protein